jgi:hypothetical protein
MYLPNLTIFYESIRSLFMYTWSTLSNWSPIDDTCVTNSLELGAVFRVCPFCISLVLLFTLGLLKWCYGIMGHYLHVFPLLTVR